MTVQSHANDRTLSTSEPTDARGMLSLLVNRYQLTPAIHVRILNIGGREIAYVTSDGWCSIAKAENATIEFDKPYIEEILGQKALCVKCIVTTGKEPHTRKFQMIGAVPIDGILASLIKKVHTNAMSRALRFALGLSVRADEDEAKESADGE